MFLFVKKKTVILISIILKLMNLQDHTSWFSGTHMHFLDHQMLKNSWSIGYQDVIAIGKLF